MIVVIDYGMGNVNSIVNMVKKAGGHARIASGAKDIDKASGLILPGVGAFDNGIKNLKSRGLLSILNRRVIEDRVPILGICLGMQLMTKSSEEGLLPGFGWFDAATKRFAFADNRYGLKIPNMGWCLVKGRETSALFSGFDVHRIAQVRRLAKLPGLHESTA